MDDMLLVIGRLVDIREELGDQVFRDACHRSLVAIARTAQAEAERRARSRQCGIVIPFPGQLAEKDLEHDNG